MEGAPGSRRAARPSPAPPRAPPSVCRDPVLGGVRLSFMPSVQKEIETVRRGGHAGHVRESRHEEAAGGLVYVFMYL